MIDIEIYMRLYMHLYMHIWLLQDYKNKMLTTKIDIILTFHYNH